MDIPPADPEQLLAAAHRGDDEALAALFDCHRDRLERIVRLRMDGRLRRRVDPVDVVQETWVAVQRKFTQFAPCSTVPFFVWLRLEVGQKLIDLHRVHLGAKMRDMRQEVSLYRGGVPAVASATLAEQLLGRLSTASKAAMRAEVKIKVEDALNTMEENDREMLVLRHFEELSNSEAANALEISPTAACNRYVRALQRLKSVFESMPGGIEGVWS